MITAKEARALMPNVIDQKLVDVIVMQIEMQISNEASKGHIQIKDVFGVFVLMSNATFNAVLQQLKDGGYTLISNGSPGPGCNPDYTLMWS